MKRTGERREANQETIFASPFFSGFLVMFQKNILTSESEPKKWTGTIPATSITPILPMCAVLRPPFAPFTESPNIPEKN